MEIKTNKPRESSNAGIAPPPDTGKRSRKKASNKLGKSQIAGRRLLSAFRMVCRVGSFVLMISFMLSVFFYAYTSDKFNLRTISFHGCKEVEPGELEAIIRRSFPTNILRIDLQALRTRLEQETWVKQVEIRRVLPSDLIITVEERVPSVIMEFRNELVIADGDGILLDRYAPHYGRLDAPVFKGVLGEDADNYRLYQRENSARIRQGMAMLAAIEEGLPGATRKISEVDISNRENLKIMLVDDTAEIYMGEKDYLDRFRTLMDQENRRRYEEIKSQYDGVESIDLRFDGQIIWRPIRTTAENRSRLKVER